MCQVSKPSLTGFTPDPKTFSSAIQKCLDIVLKQKLVRSPAGEGGCDCCVKCKWQAGVRTRLTEQC